MSNARPRRGDRFLDIERVDDQMRVLGCSSYLELCRDPETEREDDALYKALLRSKSHPISARNRYALAARLGDIHPRLLEKGAYDHLKEGLTDAQSRFTEAVKDLVFRHGITPFLKRSADGSMAPADLLSGLWERQPADLLYIDVGWAKQLDAWRAMTIDRLVIEHPNRSPDGKMAFVSRFTVDPSAIDVLDLQVAVRCRVNSELDMLTALKRALMSHSPDLLMAARTKCAIALAQYQQSEDNYPAAVRWDMEFRAALAPNRIVEDQFRSAYNTSRLGIDFALLQRAYRARTQPQRDGVSAWWRTIYRQNEIALVKMLGQLKTGVQWEKFRKIAARSAKLTSEALGAQ